MNTMKKHMNIGIIGIIILSSAVTLARAGMGKKEFSLKASKTHPAAYGTAFIDGSKIQIHARNLKPDSVYTVWFVNMKPQKHETGAGTAPYMFKTNDKGIRNYYSSMQKSPFGK